ncbi:MAG: hypothetical protein HY253_14360 [Burkholderiales bacterium]|nr:hypothetical protein [Burkholderiales bacterium]
MKKTPLALALCTAFITSFAVATPAHADDAALLQKIEKLAAELESIKAQLAASKKKTEQVEEKQVALAAQLSTPTTTANIAANESNKSQAQTIISSYGEINYTQPKAAHNQAQADVARAVIGVHHRFDEKTKMVGEFEWEHAVTSADDKGEAEVEQLYVEHEFAPGYAVKAGLFLIPMGFLNTAHEPTAYYGVHRNFIETAIIPTTWREAGFSVTANYDNGISWDAGISTGFDLSKWDAKETEGLESPLRSIHQEGQLAKSKDLSMHAAINWRGQPGLLVGGSIFSGKAGHGTADFAANNAKITLIDAHVRYTPDNWDLSALIARGSISNIDALNLTFAGQAAPVPSTFSGWYLQAAYQLWKTNSYTLSPFVRYEQFNTAKSYTAMPQGLAATPGSDEKVTTFGANFKIGEGVVLKADYQKFKQDSSRDRYNLGVGYAF